MTIYIAEDEPLAAQKLQLFLQKLGIAASDIHVYGSGLALVEALRQGPCPDLIFLDIQMPGMTGLEVLDHLQSSYQDASPRVIITSAYDRYAIDGFNYGVTDYLLKPYTLDRLRQALAKVRTEPMLSIRCEGRTERIRLADILCLEALKDYTCFHLADGRQLTSLGTLSSFEQQLPADGFVRVQRSYTVGLTHIRNYNSQSATLSNGMQVPIGKAYRDNLEQML